MELTRWQIVAISVTLTALALALRCYGVGHFLHPDSLLWYKRSHEFWDALGGGKFADTYQAPHPGVTLMWISGGVMKLQGTFGQAINQAAVVALKVPGVALGSLVAGLTFPLLLGWLGRSQWRPALVLSLLLATEPLLLEQSRVGHLDVAALGCAWLGVLCAMYAYERQKYLAAGAAGALFAFSVLSKLSLAPVAATSMLILAGASALTRLRDRRGLWVAAIATLSALLVLFIAWPALWVQPVRTIGKMLKETAEVAERGHWHVVAGKRRSDPGVGFYVSTLLGAIPLETWLLSALGLGALGWLRQLRRPVSSLILTLVPYLVIICLTPKKLSRYVLPITPVFALLATAGIEAGMVWLTRSNILRRYGDPVKRSLLVTAATLTLLCVGRLARAIEMLPRSEFCTSWAGTECDRPSNMYYMRDIALAIRRDWRTAGKSREPAVFLAQSQLMTPWLTFSKPRELAEADYVVIWDWEYSDAESGALRGSRKSRYAKLGAEVAVVRESGRLVARVLRGPEAPRHGADRARSGEHTPTE